MPPGLEPKSGSVSPKQPISVPCASAGSQRRRCSSEGEDRVHDQGALHRGKGPDAAVAPFQLLHDEAIGHAGETGAAVLFGQIRAEHAQLRHAGDEFLRKASRDVGLTDHRHQVVVDPGPDGIADGALLLGEESVHLEEVNAGEWHGRRLERCA
jgi:hypothetical protein